MTLHTETCMLVHPYGPSTHHTSIPLDPYRPHHNLYIYIHTYLAVRPAAEEALPDVYTPRGMKL
jgi:hypothetical protein